MKKILQIVTRIGRAVVRRANAEAFAIWAAALLYSLILLLVRPWFDQQDSFAQVVLTILISIPFAVLLYGFRFVFNRLWADHFRGYWLYVSYPDGYPDRLTDEDLGELGQPRFGLAVFDIDPKGDLQLRVDLYRSSKSALEVLDKSKIPAPEERVGMLESKAADYNLARDTLFVAY